jgi:uncharacterized protein involved in exopolysaccharide biosynthesis
MRAPGSLAHRAPGLARRFGPCLLVAVLRRRGRVVARCAVVGGAASALPSLQQPRVCMSTQKVGVRTRPQDSSAFLVADIAALRDMASRDPASRLVEARLPQAADDLRQDTRLAAELNRLERARQAARGRHVEPGVPVPGAIPTLSDKAMNAYSGRSSRAPGAPPGERA